MATNLDINTRLVDVSTQYSKFNKNQVLTETQLNGFLDYFDDQDRLTRTSLSGVGIVCGFNVTYNDGNNSIKLTQGRGVTTDGDLVALQNPSETEEGKKDSTLKSIDLSSKTFKFFKKFSDDKAQYKHFIKPDKTQINLWELHEENADSHTSLSSFPNLGNMVVLLYLESYSKEGDLCTQLTCDNQGIEQVARLRVLLVSPQNAQYVIGNDSIFKGHYWYNVYENLPEVSAKRVVLNTTNTKTFKKLKKEYFETIKSTNVLQHLGEGLDAILNKFNQSPVSLDIQKIFDFSQANIPTDFQYRYDALKDFIDTYNEIKELLLDLNVDCCPDIGAFPKHLLIGRLTEIKEYATFRHAFYKSPIIGSDNEAYKKVISLLEKINQLAKEYKLTNKGDEIKITPSLTQAKLSNKSIPFYYNVTGNLLEKWSFKTSKYLRTRYNLSYHTGNLVNAPSVKNPLDYNLDPFDFYRIEGHQGKMYRDALDQITKVKQDKGLSFDVKVLSIETDKKSIDVNEYKCQFEDLKVLLEAWRAEQDCVLSEVSEFLSGFSTKTAGENIVSKRKGYEKMDAAEREEAMARIEDYEEKLKEMAMTEYKHGRQKRRKNVVQEKMINDEGSIGLMVKESIEKNKGGSTNDILLELRAKVQEVSSEQVWVENKDLKEFILQDVTEVLVNAYVLDNEIPNRITEINQAGLSKYKVTIEQLCSYVKRLQAKYQKLNLKDGTKEITALLINQLSTVCCSGKKLEILYEEIQRRKEQILIQTQLCKFVEKHPGLEHRAGVIPGGTFVMVYLKEAEESTPTYTNSFLEIPFLEQPQLSQDGLSGESGFINLWEDKLSTKFTFVNRITEESQVPTYEAVIVGNTIEKTVENLADFLNVTWEKADGTNKVQAMAKENILILRINDRAVAPESYFMQFENEATVGSAAEIFFEANGVEDLSITTKNTVIADFSLPYMCCSDCAPINFIIPKEPVKLSLPAAYVCLKEGETIVPLPFDVSPADGEIKAKVPEEIPSGLITDPNGKFVFDPLLTDPSLHGKEIGFTVNEEETDCKIVVYADVPLSVTTDVDYNALKTEAIVTYTVSNVYPNLSHNWDFGDGTTSTQVPSGNGKVVMKYPLPVNNTNTIQPRLRVSNGFCDKEVLIDPITFDEQVDVTLEIIDKYCLDTTSDKEASIPFTKKDPQNAKIEVVGGNKPGMETKENELIINPSKFTDFNTLIRFTLGGQTTNARITIGRIFEVGIDKDKGGYNWDNGVLHYGYTLIAKLPSDVKEEEVTFKWILNGQNVGKEKYLQINLPLEQGNNDFEFILEVTYKNCISSGEINIPIAYPDFKLSMPNGELTYCLNDRKYYLITVSPEIYGTIVDGLGVSTNANGLPQFRAIDTSMTAAGNINLGIGGKNLLTLTMKEASKASFTYEVRQGEIVLTNTSDVSDRYEWVIDGETYPREDRRVFRLKTTSMNSVVSITLKAFSQCGEDSTTVNNVVIREEIVTRTCADETKDRIIADGKKIPKDVQFTDENIIRKIIMPTVKIYEAFEEAPVQVLDNGNIDGFDGVTSLFSGTTAAITNSVNDPDAQRILSQYFIAQVKLFFNLLHCQPHTAMESEKPTIVKTVSALRSNIGRLVEFGVNFDEEGELKQFLSEYAGDSQVVDYMRIGIKQQILPML